MKRCSTSLATNRMQIKTVMRYHYIPIRIAKIKSSDNTKSWQECRKLHLSYIAGENVK